MNGETSRAARLALLTALVGLALGGATLWLGLREGAVSFWGFGAACLLHVPPALNVRERIREGLGNRGLERERLTLKVVSHFLRLLALGLCLSALSALMGERAPQASLATLSLAVLAVGFLVPLWLAKRGLAGVHPTVDLDAARTRSLLEGAVLLLVGSLLGHWFSWADAATGLALALHLFFEGRTLAKGTTLTVACGGCGSGCH